eukprot:6339928-Amphidinium_carterae.1
MSSTPNSQQKSTRGCPTMLSNGTMGQPTCSYFDFCNSFLVAANHRFELFLCHARAPNPNQSQTNYLKELKGELSAGAVCCQKRTLQTAAKPKPNKT